MCNSSRYTHRLGWHWAGWTVYSPLPLPQDVLKEEEGGRDAVAVTTFFHHLVLHSPQTVHMVAPALLKGCEWKHQLVAMETVSMVHLPLPGSAEGVYHLVVRVTSEGFSADVLPGLVGCVVGLPGDQLPLALRLLLDCHAHWEEQRAGQKEQDEGMEEGELPENEEEATNNSPGIDPVSRIMVLSRACQPLGCSPPPTPFTAESAPPTAP